MTCHEFEEQINLYLDRLLSEEEAGQVEAHMAACPECKQLYERMLAVVDMLHEPEDAPLPEGFEEALHAKLAPKPVHRPIWKRAGAWVSAAAAAVVVIAGLWGMGALSGGRSNMAMEETGVAYNGFTVEKTSRAAMAADDYGFDSVAEEVEAPEMMGTAGSNGLGAPVATVPPVTGRQAIQDKLVYTASISLQSYRFDEDLAALRAKTAELGGYVETSSVDGLPFSQSEGNGRYGWLEIRVPQEHYSTLIDYLNDLGEVTGSEESVANITQQYTETDIRRETLEAQIRRLQELIAQAENVEDLITLESQLSNVTGELEYIKSRLNQMDQEVAYSTVEVRMVEMPTAEDRPAPPSRSFGQRMSDALSQGWSGFVSGVQDWALGVIRALPVIVIWLVILAVIGGVVTVLVKAKRKKKS